MTVLAVPAVCAICNGRGRVSESAACPACAGTGMSTEAESAKYRAVLIAAALEGAQERYRAAGREAADGWLREAEQAREAAAETAQQAGQVLDALARAQAAHLAVRRELARAQVLHADARTLVEQAHAIMPFSLPVTPPGQPVQPIPGATRDPLLLIDSIYVRELDVWGVLNIPGGSGGLLTNPMTTTGDLIFSNPGSTPVRLGIGAANQVLTVSGGLPSWQNAASGFTNPMTTLNDMIVALSGGTAARLPYSGVPGNVLTGVTSTTIGWAAPAFINPMTTPGDIIYAVANQAGFPGRLPIGQAGQVLTVAGGLPAWVTGGGGFVSPLTTTGDLIVGNPGSNPARLGIGANGQVLTSSGGLPVWAAAGGTPIVALFPSGDTTGAQDDINFNAAVATLKPPNTPVGGTVWLAPGNFYTKAGWVLPGQTTTGNSGGFPVNLRGAAGSTILNVGTGAAAGVTALDYHRTSSYGAQFGQAAQHTIGYICDLVIDGTNATGAAVGLDCGDGWGGVVDNVTVVNFSTAGAMGIFFRQRVFWCEKWWFKVNLMNNATAFYQTTSIPISDHSHEYNYFDVNMFCNQNQQGFVVDGVNMGGSQLILRGNMCQTSASAGNPPTNNIAALTVKNTTGQNNTESRWYEGQIWMKVEFNRTAAFPDGASGTNVAPFTYFCDGNARGIQLCSGQINSSNLSNSNINGSEFSFTGAIAGDNNLADLVTSTPGSQATLIDQGYTATNASPAVFSLTLYNNPGTAYPNGSAVQLSGGTPPTGFNNNTTYYVVNGAGATVQLALTPGGAAINSTSTGNGTMNILGPPMPTSGTIQQNYGPDQVVCITGGTVSGIGLAGENTGLTSGPFFVPAGGSITVNYTVAPTWAWLPAHQMTY